MTAKNQRSCLRCDVEMEIGYVTDYGQRVEPEKWIEGSPEYNFFGNLKYKGGRELQIVVFRCPECAMLEHVAPDPDEVQEGSLTLASATTGQLTEK